MSHLNDIYIFVACFACSGSKEKTTCCGLKTVANLCACVCLYIKGGVYKHQWQRVEELTGWLTGSGEGIHTSASCPPRGTEEVT